MRVKIYSLVLEWCPQLCLLITEIWVLESCDLLCAALLSEVKQLYLRHHRIEAGRDIIYQYFYIRPSFLTYYDNLKQQVKEIHLTIFEIEMLPQPTRFLLSWTSVGSVLSGTNWLGSSIFIGVPTLYPGWEDFIHWKKENRTLRQNNTMNVFIKATTRGQTNTGELQPLFLQSVRSTYTLIDKGNWHEN